MKRSIFCIILIVCLFGCVSPETIDPAVQLRDRLLHAAECSFAATVTADYGDKICTFSMDCTMDEQGGVNFSVTQPDTIRGITGSFNAQGGALTFDEEVLAFPTLADGQVTPVSAPYLLIKALRSGYIRACGNDGSYLKLQIDDSYEDDALAMDVWLDSQNVPICADILYKGRRFLSLKIENFILL